MDISHTPVHRLADAADAISSAVKKAVKIVHPESADLAFLYGTILTDGKDVYPDSGDEATANLCVFADRQVRSSSLCSLYSSFGADFFLSTKSHIICRYCVHF